MLNVFINVILPVVVVLFFGFIIGKFFPIQTKTLSTLSIYLLTPCLIFQALVKYEDLFSMMTLKILAVVTIFIAIIIVSMEIIARIFKMEKSTKVVLILTLTLSNSGNFGLPICEYAFGHSALLVASMLLVIYSFYTNTLGVVVAASEKQGMREALMNLVKMPYFYVVIAGLVVNYFALKVPDQVFKPIESIGLAAIPLNLLQLGINLSQVRIREKVGTIFIASGVKLLIVPLLAFPLLSLFGIGGIEYKVTFVQIAMPSAVYCSILAGHYDSDSELASGIVFVSTILSLISLSFFIYILS